MRASAPPQASALAGLFGQRGQSPLGHGRGDALQARKAAVECTRFSGWHAQAVEALVEAFEGCAAVQSAEQQLLGLRASARQR